MKRIMSYEEILQEEKNKRFVWIDVRSPYEFQQGTIPGAVNIPILDDTTREEVGTLYTSGQLNEAKEQGVIHAARRLPEMFRQYQSLASSYDHLVLFCSRGGMRSDSVYSLLKALGFPVYRLLGGYKAYRRYILDHLDDALIKVSYITLYGLSGSGKTAILKELAELGAYVLDLEGCANHRGSLLGGAGLSLPHQQKMFESLLYEESLKWPAGSVVFTEGESKRIGRVVMPESLARATEKGRKIWIEAALSDRVAQIQSDYTQQADKEELIHVLSALNKVMNPDRVIKMQDKIRQDQLEEVITELLVSYYDPRYQYHQTPCECVFFNKNVKQTAKDILAWQGVNEVGIHKNTFLLKQKGCKP